MNGQINIAIVEDEALIAENLRQTLEDLGYAVPLICYTYPQAMALLPGAATDLVLLDINLGNGDRESGMDIALHLQKTGIPFLFLTAYNDTATISQATRLKPQGYLIKPVSPAALFAAIQTAVEHATTDTPPQFPGSEAPDFFFVKIGQASHRLLWKEVYCMEAGKNYVRLHVAGKPLEFPIRGTLNFVLEQLVPQPLQQDFIRVSRSACLNRHFIESYTSAEIVCQGRRFENSRYSVKELQELLH